VKNILVTGSAGFVGKNLVETLRLRDDVALTTFDIEDDAAVLTAALAKVDFVFHLAGVNRPQNEEEFRTGNTGLTEQIVTQLQQQGRSVPVLLCSSTQAALDNPYGASKRQAEEAVFAYAKATSAQVFVFRLPNLFGKWCRPNYNSAVATFCHNIANDLPIQVNDPNYTLTLAYIDDVVSAFIAALEGNATIGEGYAVVEPVHTIALGAVTELLHSFKASRNDLSVCDMTDPLAKKLYSTYLSYLPTDGFSYPLKMNVDDRGSFSEFIRTPDRGQVSVNISKPGITKGNHWHHTKNEKFLVVSGTGVIRFRKIGSEEIIEYAVSGEKLEVVDIPTGYTHNISNTGESDMVTVMWVNEPFNPEVPDTFFEPV
jgi:UDP-2-acetamido-2,6-beta-L-arabino-hexul-4-ose reductase